jgi:hypothetical protein
VLLLLLLLLPLLWVCVGRGYYSAYTKSLEEDRDGEKGKKGP